MVNITVNNNYNRNARNNCDEMKNIAINVSSKCFNCEDNGHKSNKYKHKSKGKGALIVTLFVISSLIVKKRENRKKLVYFK